MSISKPGDQQNMMRIGVMVAMAACSTAALAGPAPDGHHIAEQGSPAGAPPCVSCHGAQLQGNDAIKAPALAGKTAATIVARLDHYASPEGHNATMKQVAGALSSAERQAVADYIAGLPSRPAKQP
jgi:cytochrome c553